MDGLIPVKDQVAKFAARAEKVSPEFIERLLKVKREVIADPSTNFYSRN